MSNDFPNYKSRCPIHGVIHFYENERKIIDHPFFQRLRHISQLGFANYVYTGATHSRFGHSLGVMHLAGQIFDHIVTSEYPWLSNLFSSETLRYFQKIVRLAGLLHDIGHSPFSHSSEATLPLKKKLHLPLDWYRSIDLEQQATHEDFSVAIIYALALETPPVLSLEEAQDVCALIDKHIKLSESFAQRCELGRDNTKNIYPLLKHIISGETDADRMDYLHRDSYYAGVSYGKFDMQHLVRSLSCVQTELGIVLALNHKALYTFENFLLARMHMFLQVYFHKTLLPFDHYLKQAMQDGEIDFAFTGTLDNFLEAQDYRILSDLFQAKEKKWASRIVYRKTMKRLFQFEHYHSTDFRETVLNSLKHEEISHLFLKSSRYMSMFSSQEKPQSPLLLKKHILGVTQLLPIQKVSLLLEQYNQSVDVQYLYCEPEDYQHACEVLHPLVE